MLDVETYLKGKSMGKGVAFAPCHITGIFQIEDQEADPLMVGSNGVGVSLSKGVKTTVTSEPSSTHSLLIKINGAISESCQVSRHVLKMFLSRLERTKSLKIVVEHNIEPPVGAGFGTSGAAALSLALALNNALSLNMSKTEAAQIAHVAEIECRTGLGTVIAENHGGLEIRVKPGAPGIGEITNISVPNSVVAACTYFGPLSTRRRLRDEETRRRINEIGGTLVSMLVNEPSYVNFMKLSRRFAEHVGLITARMRKILNEADKEGFVCSMPMFGESIFSLVEQDSIETLLKVFSKHNLREKIIVSEIDHCGARLIQS
jgi:pantoate kinase